MVDDGAADQAPIQRNAAEQEGNMPHDQTTGEEELLQGAPSRSQSASESGNESDTGHLGRNSRNRGVLPPLEGVPAGHTLQNRDPPVELVIWDSMPTAPPTRQAADGYFYTEQEFFAYFGRHQEWEEAARRRFIHGNRRGRHSPHTN